MTPMRHPADQRVHFSELKEHRHSPAHVKVACETAREVTRPMRVGFVCDRIVFGGVTAGGYVVYAGERRGNDWKAFVERHPNTCIVTATEYADASLAAEAVLADPVARELLDGAELQVAVQWEAYGLPCASGIAGERGGFDAINTRPTGRAPYIADLKCTSSSQPDDLAKQAFSQLWHAQGAWYLDAAKALRLPAEDFYIIAVESTPPHCVTVARIPAHFLERGRQSLILWTEKHRACELAGQWPGYVQGPIELELPGWVTLDEVG